MVVGVLKLTLFIPENHSLKGKRGVLNKIKARVTNTFNVSIAECDDQDLWQRAVARRRAGRQRRGVRGRRAARGGALHRGSARRRSRRGERSRSSTVERRTSARSRRMTRRTDRVAEALQEPDRRAAAARDQGSAHRVGDDHRRAASRPTCAMRGCSSAPRAMPESASQALSGLHSAAGFIRSQGRAPSRVARGAGARLRVRPEPRAGRAPVAAAQGQPPPEGRDS